MTTRNKSELKINLVGWYKITGAIALAVILSFLGINYYSSSPASQLVNAQKLWQTTNKPKHYRLKVKQEREASCEQELEIKNEQVIRVIKQKDCQSMPNYTVANLFKLIESYADGKECGPNGYGCDCDGKFFVNAKYDRVIGYPKKINIYLENHNWFPFLPLQDGSSICSLIRTTSFNITTSLQVLDNQDSAQVK